MSEFGYRIRILDCLLDGQQSFEVTVDDDLSGPRTIYVARQGASYAVDFLIVDPQDQYEKGKIFFEVLKNGKLLSGAKTNNGNEPIEGLPDLTDSGLDDVLNQALMQLCH